MKRDWAKARAKCDLEAGCRVCGRWPVEAAHVIGRARDKRVNGVAVVNPDSIVPMCRKHHQAFDARQLDLAPYLTPEEAAQAVLDAGSLHSALWRISGRETP